MCSPNSKAEDERKQVTVLFADITDSIDLVATHDAEVVRKVFLNPVLERMIEAVPVLWGHVVRRQR